MRNRLLSISFISIVLLFVSTFPATSKAVTIEDDNSSFVVNLDLGSAVNWEIEEDSNLFEQIFYFRIGDTREDRISRTTATSTISSLTDTNLSGFNDTLFIKYEYNDFLAEVRYVLDGGAAGSYQSDVAEQITITNTSDSALDFHFYQYVDFDLLPGASNDTVERANSNTMQQTNATAATRLSETVVTPGGDRWDVTDTTFAIRNLLEDGSSTNLSNQSGPLTGDASWAWQWDRAISASGSFQISKDKQIRPLPEPSTLLLLGTGLLGAALIRRKKE